MTTVQDLYTNYLGRAADEGGLQYWQNQFGPEVDQNELNTFLTTARSGGENVKYPTGNPVNNTQAVQDLYTQYLGRPGDQAGIDYWAGQFGSGVEANEVGNFLKAAAQNKEQGLLTPEGLARASNLYNDQKITDYLGKLDAAAAYNDHKVMAQYQVDLDRYRQEKAAFDTAQATYRGADLPFIQHDDETGQDYYIQGYGSEGQQRANIPVEPYNPAAAKMPTTAAEFWDQYGKPQEEDFVPLGKLDIWGTKASQGQGLTGWMGKNFPTNRFDPSKVNQDLLPKFSLYGTGSAEDIKRGFNVLQNMAPQDLRWIFPQLSPDVQKGILQHPDVALQQMAAYANPANHSWLSVGAEGGFTDPSAYTWNAQKGLTADPSKYLQIHDGDSWSKPLGALATLASFVPGPWQVPAMAVNSFLAARNDNPLGAVASFLPATGLSSGLTDIYKGLGATGNIANALASGTIGTGMGVLGGQNLTAALKGGALGALGGYAGSTLGDLTSAATSGLNLTPPQLSAIKSALNSALSAGVQGGNLQDILSAGALGASGSALSTNIANALKTTGMTPQQAAGMSTYIIKQLRAKV